MANITKTLNTKIKLRYDLYSNWSTNNPVLLAGEVALAYIPTDSSVAVGNSAVEGTTPPQVLIKVGDGTNHYNDLKYVSALAADVLTACKSEEGLTAFINGVIADAGIATNDAMEALAGRVTTAEGEITKLKGTGDGSVAKAIADAIAALDLANTYEVKGEAAKVQGELNSYKESNDIALANVKATAEAAYVKPVTGIDKTDLSADVQASLGKADSALQEHQDISHLAVKTEVETELGKKVDKTTYETKVGEIETAIGGKVDKVEGKSLISDSEITRLAGVTNYDDTAIRADIAKKADSATMTTELGKKVDKVEGYSLVADTEIARLADVDNYDDAEVRGLIGDNAEAIATINDAENGILKQAKDYADGKDEAIAAAKKAGDDAQADVDALETYVGTFTVSEGVDTIVKYIDAKTANIASDETVGAIDERVAAIEEDYLVEADKTELQNQITANANAIELLTNGVSAEEVDGVNDLIQYVKDHGTEVTGIKADIKAHADAIAEHEEVAAETYETKLDAEAKLGEAKTYADGLNTAMDTRVKVLEAIDHEAYKAYADQAEADAKAYADGLAGNYDAKGAADAALEAAKAYADANDNDTTYTAATNGGLKLEGTEFSIDDSIVFVFDCGDAEVAE
jgi:hypothetical protein